MEINFNTEFKDFLNNSVVYKNIQDYIKIRSKKENDPEDFLSKRLKATQAIVEFLVINHERIHNIHFARESITSIISKDNSKEAQKFVKNNKDIAEHTKYLVYLYFTEENKELSHLLEEIHTIVPDSSIKINFNKNFKGFIENSIICEQLENGAKKKIDFNDLSEEQQKFNAQLIRLSLECIIKNYNVLETTSFFNVYPTGEKSYSQETKNFIKETKKINSIDLMSKRMKSIMFLELTRDKETYPKLVEEIKQYAHKPVNKVKSKKKM